MNKLDSIKALKLLKDQYILTSSFDKEEYIFFENNGKIYVKTKKYSVSVSFSDFLDIFSDFLDIYKDFLFSPIEDVDNYESIDASKDLEYYSKIQKKQ